MNADGHHPQLAYPPLHVPLPPPRVHVAPLVDLQCTGGSDQALAAHQLRMAELGRIRRSEQAAKKRKYLLSKLEQSAQKQTHMRSGGRSKRRRNTAESQSALLSMRIRGSLSNLACTAGVQMKESCVGLIESTVTAPTAARMSFPVAQPAIS